mgnify:CR=1 FL=1
MRETFFHKMADFCPKSLPAWRDRLPSSIEIFEGVVTIKAFSKLMDFNDLRAFVIGIFYAF